MAPKIYEEDYYRKKIDAQKHRLDVLKSRQQARQERFARFVKNPKFTQRSTAAADDDTKPPRSQHVERDSSSNSLENAVIRALEDPTLDLPCSLDDFVAGLENKPDQIDVATILRSLARSNKNIDSGSISVELENADITRKMVIRAVHRSGGGSSKEEEESLAKRHKKE
jgi:hypothetical protein